VCTVDPGWGFAPPRVPTDGVRGRPHWWQAVTGRRPTRRSGGIHPDLLVHGSGVLSDDSWYSCRRTPSHCLTDHSWRLFLWFSRQERRDGSQPPGPGRKGRRCCRRRRLRRRNRALRQAVDSGPSSRQPCRRGGLAPPPHQSTAIKPSNDCRSSRISAGSWMSGWRDCSARRSPPASGSSYSGRSTPRW
jgi:hypothetical protein